MTANRGWRIKRKKTERSFELNRHAAVANSEPEQIGAHRARWQSWLTAETTARYPEVKPWSNSLVTATRPKSSSQSRSRKGRTIWQFTSMSATVAVMLLVPSGLRLGPDDEVFTGKMNQHSIQLARRTLESKPLFSDAESESNQRVRSRHAAKLTTSSNQIDASKEVTSFDVAISPTITPTSENQHKLTIDINLPGPAEQPVRLIYATLDQTAQAGQDYVASDGVLTIQPGAAAGQLAIPLIDDGEVEPNETFELMLTLDSGHATPSVEFLVATILDDDQTTEHEAVETQSRLDRRLPNTIGIDVAQGVSIDQRSSIAKTPLTSEQAPKLPAAEVSPSSIPSSSQEMKQVETVLQALIERSRNAAQPLHSSESSTTPGKRRATRSDGPTPNELVQGDALLHTRTARIDQLDLRGEVNPVMPDHQFRVQVAAARNEVNAYNAWTKFRSTLDPTMTNIMPYFEQAETTNGIFYRVQIGPFPTRDKARDLCARLKERDISCFVVDR